MAARSGHKSTVWQDTIGAELYALETTPIELSRLELLVLKSAGEGSTIETIGSAIGQCQRDVEMLMGDAMRKLNAKNRMHAITIAILKDLIGIQP